MRVVITSQVGLLGNLGFHDQLRDTDLIWRISTSGVNLQEEKVIR